MEPDDRDEERDCICGEGPSVQPHDHGSKCPKFVPAPHTVTEGQTIYYEA